MPPPPIHIDLDPLVAIDLVALLHFVQQRLDEHDDRWAIERFATARVAHDIRRAIADQCSMETILEITRRTDDHD